MPFLSTYLSKKALDLIASIGVGGGANVGDVAREIPGQTLQTAKGIGQSILRDMRAGSNYLTGNLSPQTQQMVNKLPTINNSLQQKLLGTKSPKDISFASQGRELPFAQNAPQGLATSLGVISAGLDFLPGGTSKKVLFETLAKADTKTATSILTKSRLDKKIVDVIAPVIAKKNTPKDVNSFMDSIKGKNLSQIRDSVILKPIIKDPLIQEAKKYKTFDKFINAQNKVYHGTDKNFNKFKDNQGVFVAHNYAFAEGYANQKDNEAMMRVINAYINKDAKLLDLTNKNGIKKLTDILPENTKIETVNINGQGSIINKNDILKVLEKTNKLKETIKKGGNKELRHILNYDIQAALESRLYFATKDTKKVFNGNLETFLRKGDFSMIKSNYLRKELQSLNADLSIPFRDIKVYPIKDTWSLLEGDILVGGKREKFSKWLNKKGFDGLTGFEEDSKTTHIFNPDKIKTTSQLNKIWKDAQIQEVKKGIKIKPIQMKTSAQIPSLEKTALGDTNVIRESPNKPIKVAGFTNVIDSASIDKKTLDTSKIAIRTTKTGNELPAIRKSGFYADKSIQDAKIQDIFKQTLSPAHMALKQDSTKLGGKFGVMFKKVWLPTKKAVVDSKGYKIISDGEVKNIVKRYRFKITKRNGVLLSDFMEGKKAIPNKLKPMISELRDFLNKQRLNANVVRKAMGKKEMGFIKDYVPLMQKSLLWNELIGNKATISDNFDFIIPNEAKNPFAFKRIMDNVQKPERNFFTLIDRYNSAISRDIYITPAIENIKAYTSVLKDRGLNNSAKYWDLYIRQGLLAKQHNIDSALNIGIKTRKGLKKWNQMVNDAFLTGKLGWNIATQPLSFISLTPMEAGFGNTFKAVYQMITNGKMRQFAKDNSLSLKIKSQDILANAVGEGRSSTNNIYRTKLDKYNGAISLLGSIEEQILHEASFIAGLSRAKKLKYTGEDAIAYADLVAERSQSMYNRENRALVLNSDVARTVFPFQSFAIEMLNHAKEIGTKGGALELSGRQRVGKLMRMLAGIYLGNLYSQAITGKKKTTVGTFIPFFGQFVDALISKATGKQQYSGRSPFTAIQQAEQLVQGSKDYIKYGSLKRLRKVAVNFGLAGLGIGGGAQINNIIDGISADINGEVKSVSGKRLFKVTSLADRIKAPITGIYTTSGGKKYVNNIGKKKKIKI